MTFSTTQANPNFPNNPGFNLYKGARYVPKFSNQPGSVWTNTIKYEPLTIVLWEGNSYTSKTFVPVGVDISNTKFWAETGNYNIQMEQILDKFKDIENKVNIFITPDDFEGTDSQKLALALEAVDNGGTIVLNREYILSEDLIIKHFAATVNDSAVTVIGLNNSILNLNTYQIKAEGNNNGGINWENVYFTGLNYLFDSLNLIRMKFHFCRFEKAQGVILSTGVLQQWDFCQCYFEENSNYVFNFSNSNIYCLKVDLCEFEHNYGVLITDNTTRCYQAEFINSVMESNEVTTIKFGNNTGNVTIRGCYFEGGNSPAAMDFTEIMGTYGRNIIVEGNYYNDIVGILMPSSWKYGNYPVYCAYIIRNSGLGKPKIKFPVNPTGRNLYVVWDDFEGSDDTNHQYFVNFSTQYKQFTFVANETITANSATMIISSADYLSLTNDTSYQYVMQLRNGGYPCATYRNPGNGNFYAYFLTEVPEGTSLTFNVFYKY